MAPDVLKDRARCAERNAEERVRPTPRRRPDDAVTATPRSESVLASGGAPMRRGS